jgi:hypothetical protein
MPASAPKTAATAAEVTEALVPLIAADPITVAIVLAGYFRAVRESGPDALAKMAALKPGVDPLRIELEKYRRAFLDARRSGAATEPDPVAELLGVGAALVSTDGRSADLQAVYSSCSTAPSLIDIAGGHPRPPARRTTRRNT